MNTPSYVDLLFRLPGRVRRGWRVAPLGQYRSLAFVLLSNQ